jgi:hypothetical protein
VSLTFNTSKQNIAQKIRIEKESPGQGARGGFGFGFGFVAVPRGMVAR